MSRKYRIGDNTKNNSGKRDGFLIIVCPEEFQDFKSSKEERNNNEHQLWQQHSHPIVLDTNSIMDQKLSASNKIHWKLVV
ncbi:MAG TPA: hypothetical protein VF691_21125 [Cytophagaceae bacterium]|jgi:hypothetical protein